MAITAVIGADETQAIEEQLDTIGELWGQDCGGYSLRLDPSLAFLSISSLGGSYPDLMTIVAPTSAEIGVYSVQLIVENLIGYT